MITAETTLNHAMLIIAAGDKEGNIVCGKDGNFLKINATTDGQKLSIVDIIPGLRQTYLLNMNDPNVTNIVNAQFKQLYFQAMKIYEQAIAMVPGFINN